MSEDDFLMEFISTLGESVVMSTVCSSPPAIATA